MKRFFLLLLIGAAAAFAIWFGMRGGAARISSSTVTSLLPKETLALVHLPDFNRTRADWRETDLYKLWREPALQDFLQKPMGKISQTATARQRLAELDPLEIKDAFFALTAWEKKQSKILAGFHFKGSAADAEKVIGQWRTRVQADATAVKHERVTHEQHQIEVLTTGTVTIATVYDGNWFFAANDVAALKTLLDRADGRLKDSATTLASDENFIAATKHMPMSYAARIYARVDQYFAKFSETLPPEAESKEQFTLLRQIRSISAATTFDKGKIRDVTFIAMPQIAETGALTRDSLNVAARDTFLYVASFLNLPKQMPTALGAATSGFPAGMQRLLTSFTGQGITLESWTNTFGSEMGLIGEWNENARLPSLFVTMPVKDAAKAKEIVTQFTQATNEDRAWIKSEKEGVQYYSLPPVNPMVPVAPTIALSNQRLVIGHDLVAIEGVMKRSASKGNELASVQTFKEAERLVPTPKHSFTYVDTALFYTRLDAAVRPMLVMAAAFMPAVSETVELGKLPQPEVITKHLSPIVMSQSYESDGYVSESIGPVSIYQAVLGIAASTGAGASFYQNKFHSPAAAPASFPSPTPEEDDEKDEQ